MAVGVVRLSMLVGGGGIADCFLEPESLKSGFVLQGVLGLDNDEEPISYKLARTQGGG